VPVEFSAALRRRDPIGNVPLLIRASLRSKTLLGSRVETSMGGRAEAAGVAVVSASVESLRRLSEGGDWRSFGRDQIGRAHV